jgi:hypothetical protein
VVAQQKAMKEIVKDRRRDRAFRKPGTRTQDQKVAVPFSLILGPYSGLRTADAELNEWCIRQSLNRGELSWENTVTGT